MIAACGFADQPCSITNSFGVLRNFYSNITLPGRTQNEVLAYLNIHGDCAYVTPSIRGAIVIFHEDLSTQEDLAARLSREFSCPALLVLGYGQRVLLYHLYEAGEQVDAYVSSPHDELETGDAPESNGNAAVLCAAFGAERNERRVESILRKEGKDGHAYAYAVNRHGELMRALGLPQIGAGASFELIEIGELPGGELEVGELVRTGR